MDKVEKVYSAIAAVAGALSKKGIEKDQKNAMQNYEFRGIDDLYNVLGPILAEHKLCILPRVLGRETIEGTTKKGGVSFHTILDVEFDLVSAEDGSCHAVRTQGESIDTSDKSVNKALIAAYKYLAFIMFCIPVKGMADADRDTPEIEPTASPQTAADPDAFVNKLLAEIVEMEGGKVAVDEMWDTEFEGAPLAEMSTEKKREFYKALNELKNAAESLAAERAEKGKK